MQNADEDSMARPYKITRFDRMVADIAQRFHIESPAAIISLNPTVFEPNTEYANIRLDQVGQTIQIPDEPNPDDYDWENYISPGNESLTAVCTAKNRDRRIDPRGSGGVGVPAPPWLVPQWLLDHYRNADVRASHGSGADQVVLAAGEVLMIPFPRTAARKQGLVVTPKGRVRATLDPSWLTELRTFYESIRFRCRMFERGLNRMRELQRLGLVEASVVYALRDIMRLTIDHPAQSPDLKKAEIATLKNIDTALTAYGDIAMDALHKRVLQLARPDESKALVDQGTQILTDLRSQQLDDLTKKLIAERALHPRAVNELSDVLAYAFELLEDSPLADDAAEDVAQAGKYLAALTPPSVAAIYEVDRDLSDAMKDVPAVKARPPSGALGTLVSALGSASASVGNVAGPSTLFVAIFRMRCVRMAKMLAAGVVKNTFDMLGTAETLSIGLNSIAGNSSQKEEFVNLVVKVRQGKADIELTPFLREVDGKISGRTMASTRWVVGIGVVDAVALVLCWRDIQVRGLTIQTGAAFAGAVAGSAAVLGTGLQMSVRFLSRGAINISLDVLGRGVAGAGIIVGGFQAYASWTAGDKTGALLNGVGAAGAALLLIAAFPTPASPVLAAIGGAMEVGTGIASVARDCSGMTADDWKDIVRSKEKIWWLRQEAGMEGAPLFKAASANEPQLTAKASALRQAIDSASFLDIDISQRDELSKRVPDSASIEALLGH
jgi:hypothetical protein